jgi:hypothetical protein
MNLNEFTDPNYYLTEEILKHPKEGPGSISHRMKMKKIKKIKLLKRFDYIYQGPKFYTLNKSLQENLINVLSEMNIKPEIANHMRYLGLNKEKREYINWLFKLLKMLETKNTCKESK